MNTADIPVIEATGVRRSYGGRSGSDPFEAVRGVDLTVERGELFALLGTNGAGKTSLMEVLEGLADPTAGRVRVFGFDPVAERRHVRPRTGVVLQESGFPGDLKVGEMARTWARTLSDPRDPAHVLDVVGLSHRLDVAISSLSGGERRRLDLALAVMGRPELLFLEEPTTGLDPESRRSAWDLVRGLLAEGTTVVLTTHYLEEAEQLADRLALMHEGRIVREGTPAALVAEEPGRIRFTLEADVRLPALAGDHSAVRSRGLVRHSVETHALESDLLALLTWAERERLTLGALDARSGSRVQRDGHQGPGDCRSRWTASGWAHRGRSASSCAPSSTTSSPPRRLPPGWLSSLACSSTKRPERSAKTGTQPERFPHAHTPRVGAGAARPSGRRSRPSGVGAAGCAAGRTPPAPLGGRQSIGRVVTNGKWYLSPS